MAVRISRKMCCVALLLGLITLASGVQAEAVSSVSGIVVTTEDETVTIGMSGAEAEAAGQAIEVTADVAGREIEAVVGKLLEQSGSSMGLGLTMLVPIVALLLIFGGPVLLMIVLATLHYRSRNRRAGLHHETMARLIESGQPIPDEVLRVTLTDSLHRGVRGFRNLGLGLGLFAFLTLAASVKVGALGLLFMGIGVAQLLIWKFIDSRPSDSASFSHRD